jgi:hypothetical protein
LYEINNKNITFTIKIYDAFFISLFLYNVSSINFSQNIYLNNV